MRREKSGEANHIKGHRGGDKKDDKIEELMGLRKF